MEAAAVVAAAIADGEELEFKGNRVGIRWETALSLYLLTLLRSGAA